MSDGEKRAHDLALLVVAEILRRDFKVMTNSDEDGDEAREVFAASVLGNYNFFFDAFNGSMK